MPSLCPRSGRRRAASAILLGLLAAGDVHARASIERFGTADDGQTVRLVTLRNRHKMVVRISTRGGTIVELDAPDRAGRSANITLGRPDFVSWEKTSAFNSLIGRYANRISGGGFWLDGLFYKLTGANALGIVSHGGPSGFGDRLWEVRLAHGRSADRAILTYVSPDGENGFPGELRVQVTYTLTETNRLRLDYEAVTSRPTVVNLTSHIYFNLSGGAAGPIYRHRLQVRASRFTPTDAHQLPTGEIRPVAGTPFDFRRAAMIGPRISSTDPQLLIAHGLDHNFVLDKEPAALATVARLVDPDSGRVLEVRTTEPGMQIYTANFFNGALAGSGGHALRQGDGIAFEPQHFPDSPNHANFPSTVLRPGQTFHSTTEFLFSVDRRERRRRARRGDRPQ